MTPFGIRAKLKALFGGGGASSKPAKPEIARYTVNFVLPNGSSYSTQAKEGDSLVLASGRGSDPIATGCADSTCGTCRVEVLEGDGQLTVQTEIETKCKHDNGIKPELRLGCQAGVLGEGVKVKIINVFGAEPADP